RAAQGRMPEKYERKGHAKASVGDFDAERLEQAADPAIGRVNRRERNAGDGGRERERQIDEGVQQAASRESVADQDPGDDHAKDGVDGRREQGDEEAELERGERAGAGYALPEPLKSERRRLEHKRGERDENDEAEIG